MKYQKIHIVGGPGAGKTSLAKAYSERSGIRYSEIDELFWTDVGGRSKRPDDERAKLLQIAIDSERWIIEGVFYRWLAPSFESAEKIIVLNIPKWVRCYRILQRSLPVLISDPSSYRTTIANLLEIIVFNHSYERIHFVPTLKMLERFGDKVVICNSNKEAMRELNM